MGAVAGPVELRLRSGTAPTLFSDIRLKATPGKVIILTMDDTTNDPKFWEWLRNREKPAQQEQRIQLELLKPPAYRPETNNQDSDRGVTVIELF